MGSYSTVDKEAQKLYCVVSCLLQHQWRRVYSD
jgi:hypothetical protein